MIHFCCCNVCIYFLFVKPVRWVHIQLKWSGKTAENISNIFHILGNLLSISVFVRKSFFFHAEWNLLGPLCHFESLLLGFPVVQYQHHWTAHQKDPEFKTGFLCLITFASLICFKWLRTWSRLRVPRNCSKDWELWKFSTPDILWIHFYLSKRSDNNGFFSGYAIIQLALNGFIYELEFSPKISAR